MGVIYFDIGDTLALAEFSDGKLQLNPLPGVIDALDALAVTAKASSLIRETVPQPQR